MRLLSEKVSVIVPIYKVEKYLNKCIDSIINQTYTNLEIILVDDGSPDNSPKICDEYAKKDNRIKVIHKQNNGVSSARNVGLDISTGDYIMFIDGDDYIELNMIECMLKNMFDNDVDIVVCNINYVYKDKEFIKYDESDRILNNYDAMKEFIRDGIVQAVVWNKLYKKSIIKDMKFIINKIHEDEIFSYEAISKANSIYYNSNPFYNYIQREDSITGKFSIQRLDAVEAAYERMNSIKQNYPSLYIEEKMNFCNLCIYTYQMILENLNIDIDKQGRKTLQNYVKCLKFNRYELKKYSFKDKVKIFISKISLNYCCKLLNILSH